ncbi:hypothetical protein LPJ61_004581 [Coemansia biformis]|uniref:Kinesin motor domain-containing protein n=1 Tax=Coemansia biformis TaxID=1286918 RepID=A0A9W7YAR3_9FUNG|nr:hypothetical protein LPJ61_004581 [Coemansia biformis]
MSANEFLDILRNYDLEHQYPCLYGSGVTSLEILAQVDPSELQTLGVTGRDDLANFKSLIGVLTGGSDAGGAAAYQQYPGNVPASSSLGNSHRRAEWNAYGDSGDDDYHAHSRDATGHGAGAGASRPAANGSRMQASKNRPSSVYGVPHAPTNGIPRATPAASFSPPMQPLAASEARTVGRQGIPPPGRPGIARPSRRQTIVPSSQTQGGSRVGDGGLRTMANRHGRGPRPSVSNMSEILERSNAFSQSQQLDANSDDELERVVRRPGQGNLVNAYGIPVRPTTGHVKRSASERRSMAPGAPGLRPKTAHRSSRGEGGSGGSGLAPVREALSNLNDKIRVCVRKRPLTGKEKEKGEKDIVQPTGSRSLAVMEPKVKVDMTRYIEESRFSFDEVFGEHADNTQVYERTAKPLVEYMFGGGNATCFAYGQTGSGKTYTMMDTHNGLYIQAAEDLFALLGQPGNQHLQAFVTFYEIYLANLFDLLNDRKKLFAREDASQNVCIQGVREVLIQSPEDLMSVFEYGHGCRSTGSTGANSDSSRSHAILQIALKDMSGRRPVMHGKLSFIDLAGNERGSDRGDTANKQTMMEGAEINKSLLALKECIRALDLNKRHQPFRQSKLTQVLKDSFIGNSRACMIATISPNTANSDNTLNTLRYADRVKAMKSTGAAGSPEPAGGDEYGDASVDDLAYEDDSRQRAQEDELDTGYEYGSAYGRGAGLGDLRSSSHEAFREEDEYELVDELEDEFAGAGTTYGQHRQQQQQQQPHHIRRSSPAPEQRASFEDRLDTAISEEAPSIMDEQPAFLEDIRPAPRSPRAYGSPAAKKYVSSRLVKSPTSKLRGPSQLGGSRGIRGGQTFAGHSEGSSRLPMLTRSRSDVVSPGEPPLSPSSLESQPRSGGGQMAATAGATAALRPRGSSQLRGSDSGSTKQRYAAESALATLGSAISPADSNGARAASAGDDVFGAEAARADTGIDTLVAPFGGLNIADVDALVKQHRAEIRTTTEACREETLLISAYTTFSYAQLAQQTKNRSKGEAGRTRANSWQQQTQGLADKYHLDMDTGVVTRLADGEPFDSVEKAKVGEAIEYLERLDDVLARKQQTIADLRASIYRLVWNTDAHD